MEPQKRARYSISLELPEIVEILMEDESDEELEELNVLIEGSQNAASSSASSSSSSPPPPSSSGEKEIEIEFRHRRETDLLVSMISLDTQTASSNQLLLISHLNPLHLQYFFFSSGRFLSYY